jgi:hypothetical protein
MRIIFAPLFVAGIVFLGLYHFVMTGRLSSETAKIIMAIFVMLFFFIALPLFTAHLEGKI